MDEVNVASPNSKTAVKAEILRGPFDPGGQPDIHRDNHMHLSLFAWNVAGGLSATKAELADVERYRDNWKWPNASRLLRAVEDAGFDSQLQYGMWSGYGGATGWNDACLDFATAMTASAAVTERIGIYTTIHTGYGFSPVLIAKMTAATDHLSGGRLGVNIVAAQNAVDYAQFGLKEVPTAEVRYDIADEFTTLMKHLWMTDAPVTFEGEYFQAYGAEINPQPVSRPRPLMINAAGSDIGLGYGVKHCDALFITAKDQSIEGYGKRAEKLHSMAADHDREVRICVMCYVVMDETDAKAQETVDWIIEEIDNDAIRNWLIRSGHVLNSETKVVDDELIGDERQGEEDRYLGVGQEMYEDLGTGMGAFKLFGSYETVADKLKALHDAGVGQVALCFFDPMKGAQQVKDHLLPELRKRGLNRGE
jgi:FMNH2-dependent dimethyl sulfone monooxygenase